MDQPSEDKATPATRQGVSFSFSSLALMAVFGLGIAIGFLGRPLVIKDKFVEVVITATPNGQAVAQNNSSTTTETDNDANTTPPTPTIMEFVLSDARHFQGNADAPVTIVEFSDFK